MCFIYLSFNPYRVFKFVATSSCVLVTIRTHQFQSLSGFQVRCNLGLEEIRRWDYLGFNPYRVFKFVATSVLDWARYRSSTFQSLSGFQVRCNDHIRIASRKQVVNVSIPIGFSSSLQRRCRACLASGIKGFNPYRVFKFVATPWHPVRRSQWQKFQSLSGFQVRCNFCECGGVINLRPVSIPIGFSSSLQLGTGGMVRIGTKLFQSLSGFQVRCNARDHLVTPLNFALFQSLSGFQVRCNITLQMQ